MKRLVLLLTCAVACDADVQPLAPPVVMRSFVEGVAWGSCPDGECKEGFCFADQDGSFCAPACTDNTCPGDQPVNMCGDAIGEGTCDPTGACVIPCASDDDCGAGTVCVSGGFGFCVWPN